MCTPLVYYQVINWKNRVRDHPAHYVQQTEVKSVEADASPTLMTLPVKTLSYYSI